MATQHRSQVKRERNANKDARPRAVLRYARIPVQKACFVMDAIRGKDAVSALAVLRVERHLQAPRIGGCECRSQGHEQREPLRRRVQCVERSDHEEDPAARTGQSVSDQQADEQSPDRT